MHDKQAVLFATQPFLLQKFRILAPPSITHWERCLVQCSEDLHRQFGVTISHHLEQSEKQEESYDANEGCWQVIINVAPNAFSSRGPCMSHSIILVTRSSCKCGVLFKGYPSVINNRQVPCLFSLSICLRGYLGRGSRNRRKCTSKKAAPQMQCNSI